MSMIQIEVGKDGPLCCCYFATLFWRNSNFFFSTHRFMYKKSNSFVYKFVVNCPGVPHEAETWHA